MIPLAPGDLTAVTFTHAGSAVEKAIMTAMAERGQGDWTALSFADSYKTSPSFALQQFSVGESPLNWARIDYPKSSNDDSATLEKVKSSLRGSKVAAVVVSPVQCGTGYTASDSFLKELRSLTTDSETALIIDETNTNCGATGRGFFAYSGPADYVVFGKKTQISGFFSRPSSKQHSLSFGGD